MFIANQCQNIEPDEMYHAQFYLFIYNITTKNKWDEALKPLTNGGIAS